MLNEMKTFIWNNGRPEAMRSYNDDLIIAASIACWVRDTALVQNQRSTEYQKAFLDSMTTSKSVLSTTIAGMSGFKSHNLSDSAREQKRNMDQYPWLFKG